MMRNDFLTPNGEIRRSQRCPCLGLMDDPDTAHAFASPLNRCYRGKTLISISTTQQESYCLTTEYSRCPVFRWNGAMPPRDEPQSDVLRPTRFKRVGWLRFAIVGSLLTLFILAASLNWSRWSYLVPNQLWRMSKLEVAFTATAPLPAQAQPPGSDDASLTTGVAVESGIAPGPAALVATPQFWRDNALWFILMAVGFAMTGLLLVNPAPLKSE